MIRLLALLAVMAMAAAAVVAVKLLGWWAVVVLPVALFLFVKLVAGRLIKRLFMMPFKAKGAVLRGARAQVHSVTPAERPAPAEGEEADAASDSRSFFLLEATITPAAAPKSGFSLWEPGELSLVPPGHKPESDEQPDVCKVAAVEIQQDGQWQRDEGMKYGGPQRLRMTVGVDPSVSRLQFQYYFETFGSITVPRVIATRATRVAQ
jgi:hypothetical protein